MTEIELSSIYFSVETTAFDEIYYKITQFALFFNQNMSSVVTAADKSNEIISYDPANGSEIGRLQITSADDVAVAVTSGRVAYQSWKTTSFAMRADLVMKAREVILAQLD